MFSFLPNLEFLSLKSSSLSMIDSRIASFVVNLYFLDVRDNPLTCNCSLGWIRNHFVSSSNDSSPVSSSKSFPSFSLSVREAVTSLLSNYMEQLRYLQSSSSSSEQEVLQSMNNNLNNNPVSESMSPSSSSPSFLEEGSFSAPFYLRQNWLFNTSQEGNPSKRVSVLTPLSSPSSSSFDNKIASNNNGLLLLMEGHEEGSQFPSSFFPLTPEQMLLYKLSHEAVCFDSPPTYSSLSSPSSGDQVKEGRRIIDLGPEVTSCGFKPYSPTTTIVAFVTVALVISVFVSLFFARKILSKCLSRMKKGRQVKSSHRKHRNPVVDHLSHASFLPSTLTSVSTTKLNPTPVSSSASSILHGNNNRKIYGFDPLLSMTTSRHQQQLQQQQQQLLATTLGHHHTRGSAFESVGHFPSEFVYVHNNDMSSRGDRRTFGTTTTGNNNRSNLSNRDIRHEGENFRNREEHQPLEGSGGGFFEGGIYRPRHVINNLNNPYEQPAYEVVPIVPPAIFASSAAATFAAARESVRDGQQQRLPLNNHHQQQQQHYPPSVSSGSTSSAASTSSSQLRSWHHHQQQQHSNRHLPPTHHQQQVHPSLFQQQQQLLDADDPIFNIYEEADCPDVTSTSITILPSTELWFISHFYRNEKLFYWVSGWWRRFPLTSHWEKQDTSLHITSHLYNMLWSQKRKWMWIKTVQETQTEERATEV